MAEVKYQVTESSNSSIIIIREFYDEIKAEDIINSFEYLFQKYDSDKISGIISDFDNAKFAMNLNQFQAVLKYIDQTPKLYKIKLAVIVDTPKKIVFPILAKTKLKKLRIKPFSSKEAAIIWVNKN